jgi:hypothetical protein
MSIILSAKFSVTKSFLKFSVYTYYCGSFGEGERGRGRGEEEGESIYLVHSISVE